MQLHTFAFAVAFAVFGPLSLNTAAAQDEPQYGGHLRVGYNIEPTSLDPAMGRSGGDGYYYRQMFDQLVTVDRAGNPDPSEALVTGWTVSENPSAITFTLRQNVTFHDGTPFNAEAVKFNIDRILDPESRASPRDLISTIDSTDVIDDYTIRLNLSQPWAAGFGMLSDQAGAISSPTAIEKLGPDYQWAPSATGPFRLNEVVTGSSVNMVRNEDYWGRDEAGNRLPYLDEITIKVIKDETVLVSALKAGEIDIAYLPNRDVDAFLNDPAFNVEIMEGGQIASMLVFNPDIAPLDNVHLRRAVVHAINPGDINKAVFFDKAVVAEGGMWPITTWAYHPSDKRPSYDLEKARAELAAGGKPDGFELNILTWTSSNHQRTAEIIQAQLARVGIKANIEVLSVGAAVEKFYRGGNTNLFLTSWARYPEPAHIASLNYRSGGFFNPSKTVNTEIDELIALGERTFDLDERKAIYQKIEDIELGDVLNVPLLYSVIYAAGNAKVQNLDTLISADGKMDMKYIWLKQ